MKFYVASGLANIKNARALIGHLLDAGAQCTYDWTEHGPAWALGGRELGNIAAMELQGVADADLVIVLLPGGRGTHVELGAALALGKPVLLIDADGAECFDGGPKPWSCSFHWHPLVALAVRRGSSPLRMDHLAMEILDLYEDGLIGRDRAAPLPT